MFSSHFHFCPWGPYHGRAKSLQIRCQTMRTAWPVSFLWQIPWVVLWPFLFFGAIVVRQLLSAADHDRPLMFTYHWPIVGEIELWVLTQLHFHGSSDVWQYWGHVQSCSWEVPQVSMGFHASRLWCLFFFRNRGEKVQRKWHALKVQFIKQPQRATQTFQTYSN